MARAARPVAVGAGRSHLPGVLGDGGWHQAAGPGHDALTGLVDADHRSPAGEFHLFEAMLQLFAHTLPTGARPFLLDDLQWADPASLSLVDFLHRHGVHLPLLMVGTYRDDEVARLDHPQRVPIADLAQKASRSRWPGSTTTASANSATISGCPPRR